MIRSTSAGQPSAKPADAALMIPSDIVKRLEEGVSCAQSSVLRIFCGLGCLLTFGIKRWSDAQRVESLTVAADSLVVRSWKSKKKKTKLVWAALRTGFTSSEWVTPWMEALEQHGFPGEDFLLTAPKSDLLGFTKTPARWSDAERGIHAALVAVGVPVDDAIKFTLHSFKHLLVTAGRQLGLAEPQIDVMAGWAVKASSGMPAVYDSVAASSELVYKNFIHQNFRAGWQVAEEGNVPSKPLVPLSFVGKSDRPVEASPPKAKSTQRGADLQMKRTWESPLDSSVIQVLNVPVGLVHLFPVSSGLVRVKQPKTFCGRWSPGSPDSPSGDAEFAPNSAKWTGDNSFFGFCERCYGASYPLGRAVMKPGKVSQARSSASEGDSSSSSSSESSSAS